MLPLVISNVSQIPDRWGFSRVHKHRQKRFRISRYGSLLKREIIIFLTLIAFPAWGERRVTTTTGNHINSGSYEKNESTRDKKYPAIPQDIQVPKSWETLIDPDHKDFWREGNHVPDAGFVEWATNPTIENAKLYLIRMNAKRDRLHLMVRQQEQANKELIEAGIIANDYNFLAEHFSADSNQKNNQSKSKLDQRAGHIWFYFHPTCNHCNRQAEILKGNPNVAPIQTGGDTLHNFPGLQKSLWAEKEDLKRYVSDGQVPVLVIYNEKTNKIASLKGVQSIAAINKVAVTLGRDDAKKGEKK